MIINDNCISCGACIPHCPMGAIYPGQERTQINQDECVECSACLRAGVCPVDALEELPLEWPRSIRKAFSDPAPQHALTGIPGRGTEEMKTNDVTGRFHVGEAGIVIDVGRPSLGARLSDVEILYKRLVKSGAHFENKNPLSALLKEGNIGEFKEEVLNEKVMSIIIECIVPSSRLEEVLKELEQSAKEINTVFSIGIIDRVAEDGSMENIERARRAGYTPSINAKVNIGVGRPLAES